MRGITKQLLVAFTGALLVIAGCGDSGTVVPTGTFPTDPDLCDPNPCTTPPATTCSGDAVLTYGAGVCTAADGAFSCEYEELSTPCASGEVCTGGVCEAPTVIPCENMECGTDPITGDSCGTCAPGQECSVNGQCIVPANPNGAYCGITAGCTPNIPDPFNPGQEVENPDYPNCLHSQCSGNFCLGGFAPGVIVFGKDVCTKPCEIYKDDVNNKTGEAGADGIEDEDTPISDCTGFIDGPFGAEWRCVNFADPGGQSLAYCMPGSKFTTCTSDAECAEGEGCTVTTLGDPVDLRCVAAFREGDWETDQGVDIASADMSESCNGDPFEGPLAICATGMCYGLGCVTMCNQDSDCDTTQIYEGTGCDTATGTCLGWESQTCETDLDCSAWDCGLEAQIFSDLPEWTPNRCWPKTCDTDPDCAPGFYCRYNWNGEPSPDAAWDNICLAQVADGAGLGEECDSDPDDNIPGDTCANEDLCIGGYCSALCNEDSECNEDAGQICTAVEFPGDFDDDGNYDFLLPLGWCSTFPDSTGDCLSEYTCGETETCDFYEDNNYIEDGMGGWMVDPDAPYTTKGKCVPATTDEGQWGNLCGVVGADFMQCQSGVCMGADAENNQAGYCSHLCESDSECPDVTIGGYTYTGRCSGLLLGWGGDLEDPTVNVYVSLCQLNDPDSSMADCGGTYSCPAGEACFPYVVNFGPDYEAKTEYRCQDLTNTDESEPTKQAGELCNPNAEVVVDGNTYSLNECASGLCFEDVEDGTGYCSMTCGADTDTCAADTGDDSMACLEVITQPKKGAYEAWSGGFNACRKNIDCTPCFGNGYCPGDRVCANLGQDDDTLADYRCVPSCTTDDDCAGETVETCTDSTNGYGQAVMGCFGMTDNGLFPENYCKN